MKRTLIFGLLVTSLASCGVDCKDYPVGPYYRGTYTVSESGDVYFEGADENGQRVRILIPEEYYDLTLNEDGSHNLDCHCQYSD